MPESPFSRDELYKVMQFFVDEKEAAEAVASLSQSAAELRQLSGIAPKQSARASDPTETAENAGPGRPLRFEAVSGISFTEDTLILLSLLSMETAEKVDAYRLAHRMPGHSAEEERRWQERRRELEGLPEIREWRAKFGGP